MFVYILELLNGKGNLASSTSGDGAAARSTMHPKGEEASCTERGAVLLNAKGNGKLQKRQTSPRASGNARHVDGSSPARLPRSTSAPIPKWHVYQGKQPADRPHKHTRSKAHKPAAPPTSYTPTDTPQAWSKCPSRSNNNPMPAVTEEQDTTSMIEAVETGAHRRVRNEELEYFWEQSDGSFLVEGSCSPQFC